MRDPTSSHPGIISEEREVEDMNERGRNAYRRKKRRNRRLHTTVVAVGLLAGVVGLAVQAPPLWLLGPPLAVASLAELLRPGPNMGALTAGRLAQHEPPEFRTWEEHVDEYGPDDPVLREAMKTGEIDDPEFRREHDLPVNDDS